MKRLLVRLSALFHRLFRKVRPHDYIVRYGVNTEGTIVRVVDSRPGEPDDFSWVRYIFDDESEMFFSTPRYAVMYDFVAEGEKCSGSRGFDLNPPDGAKCVVWYLREDPKFNTLEITRLDPWTGKPFRDRG